MIAEELLAGVAGTWLLVASNVIAILSRGNEDSEGGNGCQWATHRDIG
jgi:hypothetical protein